MKANTEAKKSKDPIFSSPSMQNNLTDASRLVGGIVEKGFSGQPLKAPSAPPPRPTVLPFPVARHRSHGPFWSPVVSDHGNDGGADGEHDEEDDFGKIMAFAKPVERKERKGLELAGGKDTMAGGGHGGSVLPKNNIDNNKVINVKKQSKAGAQVGISDGMDKPTVSAKDDTEFSRIPTFDKKEEKNVDMDIEQENLRTSPIETSGWSEERINGVNTGTKERNLTETGQGSSETNNAMHQSLRNGVVPGSDSLNMVDAHEGNSLEAQIDAENRARLENMTTAEIAEAQSEIMAKLSPGLLNALKKRGLGKSKGKVNIDSNTLKDGQECQLNPDSNSVNTSVDDGTSNKKMKKDSTSTESQVHHSVPHLWSSWSTRVEAVRQLRFSLDGSIVEFDFAQLPVSGSVSAQSGYGVENASERDFLRTEGDPGGVGYTIKEAVSLTRSVVPGQRAIALHLIGAILDRAIHGILQNKVGCTLQLAEAGVPDWEAIWAFALGPEPELALTLRICLDDTHDSVVSACAKVIQSVMSCGVNEIFFNASQKIPSIQDALPTAAVFRSKPQIDVGFLGGGFWKYSAKPSNILPLASKTEVENTIQDDVVVASQDIVAGLVRMGILTRIQYLLVETEPSASLEESLLSILIAIARHSKKCAAAIMTCDRLVQIVVNRFTLNEPTKIGLAKIKSVILLKVLAQMERKNCAEFVGSGTLRKVTWHLGRDISLEKWMMSGKEACGLSALLLVALLQLSRVCIMYGYSVSYFADLFPALRVWLDVPAFEKLVDDSLLSEFSAISKEAYLFVEALAKRLPNFYSPSQHIADAGAAEMETWSWTYVGGLIDLALRWTAVKKIPYLSRYLGSLNVERCIMLEDATVSSLLLIVSSAMHMLSAVLEAVVPVGAVDPNNGCLPWLPEFVPRIGLNLIRNGFSCYTAVNGSGKDSNFLEFLCYLRCNGGQEASIAATSCLQGLIQVAGFIDKLIQLAKPEHKNLPSHHSQEGDVLTNGIIQSSIGELEHIPTTRMEYALDCHSAQSIEIFGRGGPAPGVGVGWGASGGGFYSTNLLIAQLDARLVTCLLGILPRMTCKDPFFAEQTVSCIQRLNSALEICQVAGPRERLLLDKLFDFIFEAPVLKCIDISIQKYLQLNSGLKAFGWKYEEDEYILFSSLLASHFKKRWLSTKKSSKHKLESLPLTKNKSKGNGSLDTIDEEMEEPSTIGVEVNTSSVVQEWAQQRLPLPNHWFLSPISATYSVASSKENDEQDKENFVEVGQAGLFFLLGLEALHVVLAPDLCNVVKNVPVVWKLHALSVMLVDGLGIFESEKSKDTYGALQSIYGQLVDQSKLARPEVLNFKSEVHDSYCTFVEILVEQFAAVSYGDLMFGRQVAVYLHRYVEASVRLATWNALSNSRSLELLPCLKECVAEADGYLEPVEDDEKMLEAYAKSWVSGSLDKAAIRESMSHTLALHHLSCFIFGDCDNDKVSLRNQLVKSLLRDYANKSHRKGMMVKLVKYKKPSTTKDSFGGDNNDVSEQHLENRFRVLKESCEGNVSLLNHVEKLQSDCTK